VCIFKKRVSIRDDGEIFRGGQTSKKKRIFGGQPPLRLFFRHQHLINPSLRRVSLLRTTTKRNAILMVNDDENESKNNFAFGGRAKTASSFFSEKK